MAIRSRKCQCCGQSYFYCPDCNPADKLKPAYFATFCSEDCKTIWYNLTKFNMGTITKPEVKSIISTIELKPIATYAACVQRDLAVVMAEDPESEYTSDESEYVEEPLDVTPEFVFKEVFEPIVELATEDVAVHEVVYIAKEENE